MTVIIDEQNVQDAIAELNGIKDAAIAHANPDDPTMEEWEPVYDGADDVSDVLHHALAQAEQQALCPFCHYQEGTKLIPYVGHYRDPELQDHVKAKYCGQCGRHMEVTSDDE